VQTPQDYYNTDAFQYMSCKKTGALWMDQSFFYNISEPGCDAANSASCVGTGVVYRRKILDEIGGIPTATLTEDTHTSLKMSKLGYDIVYINEVVAYGIASADLLEYYKTRRRWTHGNIHVLKDEKIFSCKELTWRKRLKHISPMFYVLEGWQQLLLIFIPIGTLIFGLSPFEISVFNVLITFFFPFLSYIMLQEIGCGFSRLWTNEIFAMIRWPIYLRATAAFFNRPLKWSSSLKNVKGQVSFKLMLPQIFALVASIFALIIAAFHLQKTGFKAGPIFLFFKAKILSWFEAAQSNQQSAVDIHQVMKSGYTFDLVLVAGVWVIYNIFRVIFFIKKVINDSKNSHEFFRFKTPFAVTFAADKKLFGRILEISEEWLRCCNSSAEVDYKIGDCQKILVHLPTKILPLEVKIEKISGKIFEGKIIWNSVESRDDLANAIYSVDWHREFLNRNAYFLTPSDCLLNQIRLVSNLGKFLIATQRVNRCIRNNFFVLRKLKFFSQIECKLPNWQKYQAWNSLLYQGKTAVIANFLAQKNLATVIVFEELPIGSKICGYKISDVAVEEISLKILQEESLSSLVENGLDGSIVRRYTVECE